jgi:riboflavin synthase
MCIARAPPRAHDGTGGTPPARPTSRARVEEQPVFTGIVEELGRVVAITALPEDAARIVVAGPRVAADAVPGASIAVNGTCLTVVDPVDGTFGADVMAETLRRTTLGSLRPGDPVNLERPMAADGRFGGHIVQGHVDGVGTVRARRPSAHWEVVEIGLPPGLARYLVEQGSITVDGVSLTVVEVDDGSEPWFSVSLIPTTLAETTLGSRAVGDRVNLEVDVLAKYVERMLAARA